MTRSASDDGPFDGETGARQRHDPPAVDLVDEPQPVDVAVEQQHLRLHPLRDPRGVPPDVPCAQHHDPRGSHPGCAAEQDPASAVLALEEVRTDLGRHPPRDLAHRGEQRERAGVDLDGFVRDAEHLAVEQRVGDRGIGREMEIGEEDEPGTEMLQLARLGLLHLEHEVGAPPRVVGGRHDLGTRGAVDVVGNGTSRTRVPLDEHRHVVDHQLMHAVGGDRDAVLTLLRLTRHAHHERCGNAHRCTSTQLLDDPPFLPPGAKNVMPGGSQVHEPPASVPGARG